MSIDPSLSKESMTVTEDVVRDLLPLYFDGEGSADTRNLVETWLARHPNFAQAVRNGSRAIGALSDFAAPPVDPAAAKVALKRVHRIILLREVSHGLAMALTVCPFLVVGFAVFQPAEMPAELRGKLALCVGLFLLLAAPCWALYLGVRRSVRAESFG
jgi:anti-sigma factor RsiW